MALHTGEAQERDGDYFGPTVNRAARLMAAGHGGQVLVSGTSAAILEGRLPAGFALDDLGEYRLRDLARPERVFLLVGPGLTGHRQPLRTSPAMPGNLPPEATSLIGRDQDVADVLGSLEPSRLITLTGVGGVGKTRLALRAAAEAAPGFPDGAWQVELAPLGEASAVGHAVAATLDVVVEDGRAANATIADALARRRLLLVLDNCEHVLDAVADLAEAVLETCPGVRLLATSREPLGIEGERVWPVRSLSVEGDSGGPAARLFVTRAVEAGASLDPQAAGRADVRDICRRLDGIPLAIELAAARVRALGIEEIALHLDERFRLLAAGRRRRVERHQTLRAAVDWSYNLLDERARAVFDRLAVFAGSFDGGAAAAVCADLGLDALSVLDLVAQLVERSMVEADTERSGRYRLLETLRQYGLERLDEAGHAEEAGRCHAEYFASWVMALRPVMRGPREAMAVRAIEGEMDNLRAAFEWAASNRRFDVAAKIVDVGWEYAFWRTRNELLDWADSAADPALETEGSPAIIIAAVGALGAWVRSDVSRLAYLSEAALSGAEGAGTECLLMALSARSHALATSGDIAGALAMLDQVIEISRAAGNDMHHLDGLFIKAATLNVLNQNAGLPELARLASIASQRLGMPTMRAAALNLEAMIAPPLEALNLVSAALEQADSVQNRWVARGLRRALAMHAADVRTLLEVWGEYQAAGDIVQQWLTVRPLIVMLDTTLGASRADSIAVLIGLVDQHRPGYMAVWGADVLAAGGRARDALGEERFDELVARGCAIPEADALPFVRSLLKELAAAAQVEVR